MIFLLVDIYTMHRINTFSVIFRVSVKLSEVWSLIKDTKRQMGYWGKSQMIKIRKRRCFSGRSVLRSQCMQTCWEKLYRSFFIHFFPWWLSNVAYFEFIAYSICMNILRVQLPQKWDHKLWWITFCVLKFDNSHNKSKVLLLKWPIEKVF